MKPMSMFAIFLSVALFAIGCSTTSELRQAQQSYSEAHNTPMIAQKAPTALSDAQMALEKAENAKTFEEQIHYAYIAQRNVDLAKLQSSQAEASMKAAQLEQERNDLYAALSSQEAAKAQQELRGFRSERQAMAPSISTPVFGFDQAQLLPDDQRSLEQLSSFLKENPDRSILVEGFTDNIGSDAYNVGLGKRRADAVAKALEADGISPERITTRGIGAAFPAAPNTTVTGRQQNRRAVITILNQEQ